MKIVSISQDFFDLVEGDRELMLKHNRPCIVGRPSGRLSLPFYLLPPAILPCAPRISSQGCKDARGTRGSVFVGYDFANVVELTLSNLFVLSA